MGIDIQKFVAMVLSLSFLFLLLMLRLGLDQIIFVDHICNKMI